MSLSRVFFLAFACLTPAALAQHVCELGDCEDSALLQRELTNNLARESIGADNSDVIEKLEALQEKSTAAGSAAHAKETIEFGKNVAGTIDCLKTSSTCSKPELAESVLKTVASGLAVAEVLPDVGILAGLGAIALGIFFPSAEKKAAAPAPLTLKEIGQVVSNQLVTWAESEVANFELPSLRDNVVTLIDQVENALTGSNASQTWTEFHSSMPNLVQTCGSLVLDVSMAWNLVANPAGWVDTKLGSLETFSTSCANNCPADAGTHWTNPQCAEDLNTATATLLPTLWSVAGKLSSVSTAMALVPVMAQAVYTKYGHGADLFLNNSATTVLPLVKTSLKVNRALSQMQTECQGTFGQYANLSGTNMRDIRYTDRDHSSCQDVAWNGLGWEPVTYICFCDCQSAACDFGDTSQLQMIGQYLTRTTGGASEEKKNAWLSDCEQNLRQVTGLHSEEFLCTNIWAQGGYFDDAWSGRTVHGNEYWVCARPDACAPSACSSFFTAPQEQFGWQE